ncbi:MAG: hypothetical protein A2536_09220 [Candidatus Firestonebacteria bacterium RIFOXYD2_FULL_39_29]|nr:MAG: hypothetical protein A2536_09220 [Candidatus Firestonebacteria bacterium RIFOXYD2_FULL_39_29]
MAIINSWKELFDHWEKDANKYSALSRLRNYYDTERERVFEPANNEMMDIIRTEGQTSLKADRMTEIFSRVNPEFLRLTSWYNTMICEIENHYK